MSNPQSQTANRTRNDLGQLQGTEISSDVSQPLASRKSLDIARAGIQTDVQFAGFMSALIGDVMDGSVGVEVASAACRAGQNLLKIVEMRYRYGDREPGHIQLVDASNT